MITFNKAKIKSNFSRACKDYECNAILQKKVVDNLMIMANDSIKKAHRIIDLGSGTGFISDQIIKHHGNKEVFNVDMSSGMLDLTNNYVIRNASSKLYNICCDIEYLPFGQKKFDLALSSLSFQWLNNLEQSIINILNLTKKKLFFSIVGHGSLKELKQSCKKCNINLAINNFIDEVELVAILDNLNLEYKIKSEDIILEYHDLFNLLKSIKSIGASYGGNNFLRKSDFETLNSFYLKNFNLNGRVYCTWKIFYVQFT